MTTLDSVTVGHALVIALLVTMLIATLVRIIATSKILKQGHTHNKQVRGEQEEMPASQ